MTEMLFEYRDVSYEVGNEHRAIVKIAKMESPSYAKIRCLITNDAFAEYSHLIDKYACDAFSATTLTLDLLSKLNDKNGYVEMFFYSEFSITIPQPKPEKFDVFQEFPNIRHFSTSNGIPKLQLQSYFPNLEALDISSWGKNKIAYQEGSWPNLKFLQVFNISDLKPLVGWDLQTLFLHSPRIDDLEELKHFPNLKTLMISGTGKSFDLSPLSHLKKLKNLKIESRKAPIWGDFQSDSLKMLMLDYIDSRDRLKTLPNLEFSGLYYILDALELEYQRHGDEYWDEHGDPFTTILGPYFMKFDDEDWGEDE